MSIVQLIYNPIINTLYKITSFMSPKAKDVLLTVCLAVLEVYYLMEYSTLNRFTFNSLTAKALFTMVMILLVMIFSINEPVREVRINILLSSSFFVFIVSVFVAACLHPLREGYVLFAATLLLMPAFYIVWGNRGDYENLFIKIAKIWTAAGLGYYLLCMILTPPDSYHYYLGRYSGLTSNPNVLGMVTVSVTACALYLITINKLRVMAVLAACLSVTMVWISGSRTATLAILLMLAAFFIMLFRKREPLQNGIAVPAVCVALALALGIGGAFTAELPSEKWGYYGVEEVRVLTDSVMKFTDEELQELGMETPVSSVDLKDAVLGFLASEAYAESETEGSDEEAAEEDDTVNVGNRIMGSDSQYDYSNGRLGIYQQIIEQANLEGHDPNETFLYFNDRKQIGAHNTPLEFTFECGIISGMECLLIEIIAAVYVLSQLFGKKETQPGNLFAVLIMTGYGIESMLEMQVVFGNRDLVLLFYIVMAVVFVKTQSKKKE